MADFVAPVLAGDGDIEAAVRHGGHGVGQALDRPDEAGHRHPYPKHGHDEQAAEDQQACHHDRRIGFGCREVAFLVDIGGKCGVVGAQAIGHGFERRCAILVHGRRGPRGIGWIGRVGILQRGGAGVGQGAKGGGLQAVEIGLVVRRLGGSLVDVRGEYGLVGVQHALCVVDVGLLRRDGHPVDIARHADQAAIGARAVGDGLLGPGNDEAVFVVDRLHVRRGEQHGHHAQGAQHGQLRQGFDQDRPVFDMHGSLTTEFTHLHYGLLPINLTDCEVCDLQLLRDILVFTSFGVVATDATLWGPCAPAPWSQFFAVLACLAVRGLALGDATIATGSFIEFAGRGWQAIPSLSQPALS